MGTNAIYIERLAFRFRVGDDDGMFAFGFFDSVVLAELTGADRIFRGGL